MLSINGFLVCSKEYVQKKLLELNGLFQNQTSPEKIRSEFLPDIKASAYNVFKLLIDTYTEEKDYQADNKNNLQQISSKFYNLLSPQISQATTPD